MTTLAVGHPHPLQPPRSAPRRCFGLALRGWPTRFQVIVAVGRRSATVPLPRCKRDADLGRAADSRPREPGGSSRTHAPERGMATIRDKLGHWPSVRLGRGGEDGFAFHVETRPQRLTQRRATDPLRSLARPTLSAFSAAFPPRGLASPKANRGRVCRPIANPAPVISRVGEMVVCSAWPFAESGIGASQGYVETDVRERMAHFVANRCHTPNASTVPLARVYRVFS